MKTSQFNQNECLYFWEIAGELRQAVKKGRSHKHINIILDELEGISRHTDQVTLRKRCVALLSQFRVAEASDCVSL